jgi:hypothetical protein
MTGTALPDLLVDLLKELPSRSGKPLPAERAWFDQDLYIGTIYHCYADAVEVGLEAEAPGVVWPLTEQYDSRAERRETTCNFQSGSPATGSDHGQVDR